MAKTLLDLGNQKAGLGSCLNLKKWLFILLIFLLSSLVVINCFTIGEMRFVPLGNGTIREKLLKREENRVFVNMTKTPMQVTLADETAKASGYLIRHSGCRIPDLSPFEPNIKSLLSEAKPFNCDAGTHPPLVRSNSSALFIDPEGRRFFYNDTKSVDCCWRPFWRTKDRDNHVTFSKDCHKFQESTVVNEEFVKIECSNDNKVIYRDYYAFVPRKTRVEENCQRILNGSKTSARPSVFVVGIDSVSRINFHRRMPLTSEALKKLGAVEMFGYTKVADNTYPNLIPVLSGLSEEEFERKCWTDKKGTFDQCPLIWKNFSALGYRTIFAEDACSMTTFNYLKPGFRKAPTDYYLRPFCVAAEDDIGNTHRLNANLCLGTRRNFENLIDYAKKVADEFVNEPYFGFIWEASLTHDFHEYPQLGDVAYRDLINYLGKNELLKNAVFIFMSDHGMRWGSFRQTYQGRLEDSLPLFYIAMPDWWKKEHSKAFATLKRNARSLTTHFDLHETLLDILHSEERLSEKHVKAQTDNLSRKPPRGISMFLPIPDYRNCEMAGIPEHYCMCHNSRNVSLSDQKLSKVSKFLLFNLNQMLKQYPQCAALKINKLIDAKTWSNVDKDGNKNSPWFDYTVTLQTDPGNAIFEGTVRYFSTTYNMKLLGSIGRLNAYGTQSACVDNFNMRLYCYCSN